MVEEEPFIDNDITVYGPETKLNPQQLADLMEVERGIALRWMLKARKLGVELEFTRTGRRGTFFVLVKNLPRVLATAASNTMRDGKPANPWLQEQEIDFNRQSFEFRNHDGRILRFGPEGLSVKG